MPIFTLRTQSAGAYVVFSDTETKDTIVHSIVSSPYVARLWLIDHMPCQVVCEYPEKDEWDLDDVVRYEMARYGGKNVRGGNYTDDAFGDADMVCIDRHVSAIRKQCAGRIQSVWRGFHLRHVVE